LPLISAPTMTEGLSGAAIIQGIKDGGARTVVALPDIVTCESVLWPLFGDPEIDLVAVCKEDEGVSICAGLSYCDRRAVLLIQHTGFLDSINAIRAIAVEYSLPVVMLVGLQGMEPDRPPSESGKYGIRILGPICDAMGLTHDVLMTDADAARLPETIDQAYRRSQPHVIFIARTPSAPSDVPAAGTGPAKDRPMSAYGAPPPATGAPMPRDRALQVLAKHHADGVVVPVYQGAFDWMQIRPHPLNYLCTGAMGQAVSHALGLAIGAPTERVLVLDGDGSLLMNLGALVTVASRAPANLVHMVLHNGHYEVNGAYPVPGGRGVDFAGMAKAAGYASVFAPSGPAELEATAEAILNAPGPVFCALAVEPGAPYPRDYVTIHSTESRETFRQALSARLVRDDGK